MARPLIPFVQNGYYASRNWIPLVKGNGFTTSGGGEQEEVWETASGSVVTFDAIAAPLRQLSVAVEPVQNLNGYDSPWPAGGGVNICPPIADGWVNGYVTTDGSVNPDTTNGEKTSPFIKVEEELAYSFSYNLSGTPSSDYWSAIGWYDENNTFLRRDAGNTGSNYTVRMATAPSGAAYARVSFRTYNMADWVQFEQSSSFTSYAPYSNICPITGWDSVKVYHSGADTSNPTVYTIQLGETVYGGTLDVVNGKMTVETVKYTFNGTENWNVTSSIAWRGTLYSTGGTIKPNANNASKVGVVCDYFKEVTPNEAYSKSVGIAVDPNGYVFIVPTGESLTVDSFKAWLAEHNVTAVFPLATPFELTLTPEQISTLQGTNNVWSDAGDVTVEYRAQ